MSRISDPLRQFIKTYGNVETYDPQVVRYVTQVGSEYHCHLARMKEQLVVAIDDASLDVQEIEALTHNSFDDRDEVVFWLRELLASMS